MPLPKLKYGDNRDVPATIYGVRHHDAVADADPNGPQLNERLYDLKPVAGLTWIKVHKDTSGQFIITVKADEVDALIP